MANYKNNRLTELVGIYYGTIVNEYSFIITIINLVEIKMRAQLNLIQDISGLSSIFEIMAADNITLLTDANRAQSILYANNNSRDFIDEKHILGKSIFLISGSIGRFFRENRQKIREFREQRQSSKWLIMAKNINSKKYCVLELTDSPIYQNNKYTGSYVRMVEQKISNNKNIMIALNGIDNDNENLVLNDINPKPSLSPLEYEIAFLLMLGKAPKEITQIQSNILGREICSSTVSSIINKRIYPKLGATSISQLFKQVTLHDIVDSLPEKFITKIGFKGILLEVSDHPFTIQ